MRGALIAMRLLCACLLFSFRLTAQDPSQGEAALEADSVEQLSEVTVSGYISGQPLLTTPTSVGIVNATQLRLLANETFLPAINTVPGVRMEERSPGSYRLSIRGSLLRSPWGVRNVKVYLDEFPLTDAGGNTYLNMMDPRGAGRLEILKGPHGSLFGANSGGVLLINTSRPHVPESDGAAGWRPDLLKAGLSGGSYGLFHENLYLGQRWSRSQLDLNQAFIRSDGYRDHSRMSRHYLQAGHRWNYRPNRLLNVLAVYADMDYATPGGLNQEQYDANPRQARPAAGPNPGAVEQQAGIRNRTLYGGVSHQIQVNPGMRHLVALFGSHTDFQNPFITNYEIRDEGNYGFRTYLELDGAHSGFQGWKWHLGLEWQRSDHEISNFDNLGEAVKGDLQASGAIRTSQYFYFTRLSGNLTHRLRVEGAVSLNHYRYVFEERAGEAQDGGLGERTFSPQWMPRLSLSYLLKPQLSWRASLSKGFSPPTTAEIRPSNMVINTGLDPETGWNYETGVRFGSADSRWHADASVFYYRMDDAIVRRLDEGGAEFFANAGGTDQLGVESRISVWLWEPKEAGVIRGLQLSQSYTYSHFRFRDYRQGDTDHSGNELTGVPRHVAVSGFSVFFPRSVSLAAQHNYTSRIPLDDANSMYADAYHLVQLKLNWRRKAGKGRTLEFYAGVDNVLNAKYSLGNDINAFGGRYYNAAPLRNFFGGMNLSF